MMLTEAEFMALHRHYMWALVIKKDFEAVIADVAKKNLPKDKTLFPQSYGAYMSIWYGLLYGILEVLREKKVVIPEIQNDIDSIYESLRRYRNAVFHPQSKYYSDKFFEIMKDPDSPTKIWNVSAGLGGFFLDEFARLNAKQPGRYVQSWRKAGTP